MGRARSGIALCAARQPSRVCSGCADDAAIRRLPRRPPEGPRRPTARPEGAVQITVAPVDAAADQAPAQVRRHAVRQRGGDALQSGGGADRPRCTPTSAISVQQRRSAARRRRSPACAPSCARSRRALAKARADEARGRELLKGNIISPQEYEIDADRRGGRRGAARLAERQPARTSACARRSAARW